MVILEQREFERLRLQAESAYPEESCAILLGRRDGEVFWITRALPAMNMHPEPGHAYQIAPQTLVSAQRKAREDGVEVLGFAHSHPNNEAHPSMRDQDDAMWTGSVYAIASVVAGAFRELRCYVLEGSAEQRTLRQMGVRVAPTTTA